MARRFGKVQQRDSGRWTASFIGPNGHRVRAPLTYATRDEAETWLAAQRTDVARGTWDAHETGRTTLRTYSLEWLRGRRDLRPRTTALYASLLDLHVLPTLGGRPLRELTPPVIRRWHNDLGDTTGPTARAQSYRLLRTILNQAVRDQELQSNPCQIRGGGSVEHAERPMPTLPQIHALSDGMPPRYRAAILVAAYGGLRFGELSALRRQDVELPDEDNPDRLPSVRITRGLSRVGGRWVAGAPKTKAGVRTVALPAFLGPVLAAHMASHCPPGPEALLFGTRSGQPVARSNFGQTFRRVRDDLGLPAFHVHDLRHAAATLAVQSGATLKETMARLGHASPRAALIYQHAASDRDEAIARALGEAAAAARAGNVVPLRRRPASVANPHAEPEPEDPHALVWLRLRTGGSWHLGGDAGKAYCGMRLHGDVEVTHGDQPAGRLCRACAQRKARGA